VVRALPLCALVAACSSRFEDRGTATSCDPQGGCPDDRSCVAGICVLVAPPPASWWDERWRARRPLVVRNQSNDALAAQIGWKVNLEAVVGEDQLEALRVAKYYGPDDGWSTEFIVVDTVGADHVVWFSAHGLAPNEATVLWIYFDNPAATPEDRQENDVFPVAESFVGLPTESWVVSGAVVDDGGELRFDGTGQLRSLSSFESDHAVDILAHVSEMADRFWFGLQGATDGEEPTTPWLLWSRRSTGDAINPEYSAPGTDWTGTAIPVGVAPHVFTVERRAGRVSFLLDHELASPDHEHTFESADTSFHHVRVSNEGTSSIWINRIRVRRIADPSPELFLGEREDFPGP
jgi:hypothetical protein